MRNKRSKIRYNPTETGGLLSVPVCPRKMGALQVMVPTWSSSVTHLQSSLWKAQNFAKWKTASSSIGETELVSWTLEATRASRQLQHVVQKAPRTPCRGWKRHSIEQESNFNTASICEKWNLMYCVNANSENTFTPCFCICKSSGEPYIFPPREHDSDEINPPEKKQLQMK